MTDDEIERIRQRLVGHLRVRDEQDGVEGRDYDVEVVAAVDLLWCGWECDYMGFLFRMRPSGETRLAALGGVEVGPDSLVEMLQERLVTYRKAIRDTEAFIAQAKGLPPPEPEREWRWLCVLCNTEGKGAEPKACPTCGADDAWYCYNTMSDDTQPAMERLHQLLKPGSKDV